MHLLCSRRISWPSQQTNLVTSPRRWNIDQCNICPTLGCYIINSALPVSVMIWILVILLNKPINAICTGNIITLIIQVTNRYTFISTIYDHPQKIFQAGGGGRTLNWSDQGNFSLRKCAQMTLVTTRIECVGTWVRACMFVCVGQAITATENWFYPIEEWFLNFKSNSVPM